MNWQVVLTKMDYMELFFPPPIYGSCNKNITTPYDVLIIDRLRIFLVLKT